MSSGLAEQQARVQDLRTYRPPAAADLALPDSFVWPRYEGRCVGNLAATVAQMLGAAMPGALPPLDSGVLEGLTDGVKRVVLLVMDGMGWLQLRRTMARYDDLAFHRLAERGRLVPLTTTFLSTTNSVLSTIWTGYPPIAHGLLGFKLYLREWMMVAETIGFSSPFEMFSNTLTRWGYDPNTFLPVPAVGQVLGPQGVTTVGVIHNQYTTSPLSLMHFRGATEVRGHAYASDFWLTLRRALEDHRGKRLFVGGYWAAVDSLGHKFGPEDESADAEMRAMAYLMEDVFLDRLPAEDRDGTLLLVTADHGQILTPAPSVAILADHPGLRDLLWMPPVGEGRVPFFYARHGTYDAVWSYLHEHFAEQFAFLTRDQVIESGLLGPGEAYSEVPFRLGDIVGIAKDDAAFSDSRQELKSLTGRHGGLAPEEMLVPLLAVRLDG